MGVEAGGYVRAVSVFPVGQVLASWGIEPPRGLVMFGPGGQLKRPGNNPEGKNLHGGQTLGKAEAEADQESKADVLHASRVLQERLAIQKGLPEAHQAQEKNFLKFH